MASYVKQSPSKVLIIQSFCVFQGRIMERCRQPLVLLWLSAVVAINILGISQANNQAVEDDKLVGRFLFYSIFVKLSLSQWEENDFSADTLTQSDNVVSGSHNHTSWFLCSVCTCCNNNRSITHQQVKNLTNKQLQVIPQSGNSSSVTKLVIEGSLITLNDTDRLALASYPRLVELHLDGNLVTSIPAKYFSVVPQLRVLSLSRNKISR